ncbi:MAG: hypothetical protein DMF98_04825 [Acidobacteria bacterium]|nr:MAG: hypothetical protein DMF98_04825 [Acidobacteriota bacterium]
MPACFQLHQDHQQHEWPRRHEDTKKTAITQCRSVSTRGAKRRVLGLLRRPTRRNRSASIDVCPESSILLRVFG